MDTELKELLGKRVSVLLALPSGKTTVQGLLLDASEQTLKLRSQAKRTKGRETLLMLSKVVAVQEIEQHVTEQAPAASGQPATIDK